MNFKKQINFINNKHKENYLELTSKYPDKCADEYIIIFKLLALESIFYIAKDYVNTVTINFMDMFKDDRLSKEGLIISNVAYSLFSEHYKMNLNSISRLDTTQREFILECIYKYDEDEEEAS